MAEQRIDKSGSQSMPAGSTTQVTSWTSDGTYPGTVTSNTLAISGGGAGTASAHINSGGGLAASSYQLRLNSTTGTDGTLVGSVSAPTSSGVLSISASITTANGDRLSLWHIGVFIGDKTVTAASTYIDWAPSSTAWSSTASATQTVGSSADGGVAGSGGASGSATATSAAAGTRATSGSATGSATASGSADGSRATATGASATAFATGTADGYSGGSVTGTATATGTAAGTRTAITGASGSAAATGTADGGVVGHGQAAATTSATGTAAGTVHTYGAATGSVSATSSSAGALGDAGGATGSATATGTAAGTTGGSAHNTAVAWGTADGHVHYADGHLDITQVTPAEAFARAEQVYTENYSAPALLDIRLHDPNGYPLGQVGDYISATGTFQRNTPGPGTIVLKGTDPYGATAMGCKKTTVPVTMRTDRWKWTGRVQDCLDQTVDGVNTYSLQLIDDLTWASKIMVFPTWWSPIEFQPIKEAIYIGPAVTCIKNMWSEQILRLYYLDLVYDLINNIGQPAAMVATLLAQAQNGFEPPIAVVPTNPLTDTSKWTCMVARMQPIGTVIESTLKDCGLRMKVWLWEPGDPIPAGLTLTVPTIVVDVVDETNVQGITGTALDGLIGTAVEFADTSFGAIITALSGIDESNNHDTDATNPYAGILSDWLGLDSRPPWVIYEDGPYSAVKESTVGAHTPQAYTVITGGSSPDWVNKLVDLLLEALLSAILAYAGVSGVSDNLLDGVFDNIFLAFMQVEDVGRRLEAGKFGFPEALTSTGGTAWTANGLIALEDELWTTRGQYTFQFVTRDGQPYLFGPGGDMDIGHAVSFIYKEVIYTDYLDTAVFTDDRSNVIELKLTVGDNNPQQSPWAKMSRYISSADSAIKAITLAG